jgi:hypothetical protein
MIKHAHLGTLDLTPPTITITSVDEETLAEITRFDDAEPIHLTQVTLTFSTGNTYVGRWDEPGLVAAYTRGRITIDELEAALDRLPR